MGVRDNRVGGLTLGVDQVGSQITDLARKITSLENRVDDGGGVGVDLPEIDQSFTPLFERFKHGIKVTLAYFIPNYTISLQTALVARAETTSEEAYHRRIKADFDDISDDDRALGRIERRFQDPLEPETQYDVVRLRADDINGVRHYNPPDEPSFAPAGTDPGYPDNILFTFTTPAFFENGPSAPELGLIIENALNPATEAFDADIVVICHAPIVDGSHVAYTGIVTTNGTINVVGSVPFTQVTVGQKIAINNEHRIVATVAGSNLTVDFRFLGSGAGQTMDIATLQTWGQAGAAAVHPHFHLAGDPNSRRFGAGNSEFTETELLQTFAAIRCPGFGAARYYEWPINRIIGGISDGADTSALTPFTFLAGGLGSDLSLITGFEFRYDQSGEFDSKTRKVSCVWTEPNPPIAKDDMDFYRRRLGVGTVSIPSGSGNVTGVGTLFTEDFVKGDQFIVGAQIFKVLTVPSNVSMTVSPNSASLVTAQPYTISKPLMHINLRKRKYHPPTGGLVFQTELGERKTKKLTNYDFVVVINGADGATRSFVDNFTTGTSGDVVQDTTFVTYTGSSAPLVEPNSQNIHVTFKKPDLATRNQFVNNEVVIRAAFGGAVGTGTTVGYLRINTSTGVYENAGTAEVTIDLGPDIGRHFSIKKATVQTLFPAATRLEFSNYFTNGFGRGLSPGNVATAIASMTIATWEADSLNQDTGFVTYTGSSAPEVIPGSESIHVKFKKPDTATRAQFVNNEVVIRAAFGGTPGVLNSGTTVGYLQVNSAGVFVSGGTSEVTIDLGPDIGRHFAIKKSLIQTLFPSATRLDFSNYFTNGFGRGLSPGNVATAITFLTIASWEADGLSGDTGFVAYTGSSAPELIPSSSNIHVKFRKPDVATRRQFINNEVVIRAAHGGTPGVLNSGVTDGYLQVDGAGAFVNGGTSELTIDLGPDIGRHFNIKKARVQTLFPSATRLDFSNYFTNGFGRGLSPGNVATAITFLTISTWEADNAGAVILDTEIPGGTGAILSAPTVYWEPGKGITVDKDLTGLTFMNTHLYNAIRVANEAETLFFDIPTRTASSNGTSTKKQIGKGFHTTVLTTRRRLRNQFNPGGPPYSRLTVRGYVANLIGETFSNPSDPAALDLATIGETATETGLEQDVTIPAKSLAFSPVNLIVGGSFLSTVDAFESNSFFDELGRDWRAGPTNGSARIIGSAAVAGVRWLKTTHNVEIATNTFSLGGELCVRIRKRSLIPGEVYALSFAVKTAAGTDTMEGRVALYDESNGTIHQITWPTDAVPITTAYSIRGAVFQVPTGYVLGSSTRQWFRLFFGANHSQVWHVDNFCLVRGAQILLWFPALEEAQVVQDAAWSGNTGIGEIGGSGGGGSVDNTFQTPLIIGGARHISYL